MGHLSLFLVVLGFFYHLLEGIYGHHHWHTKVLSILDLLPHVTAALFQQLKVLDTQTHKHAFS